MLKADPLNVARYTVKVLQSKLVGPTSFKYSTLHSESSTKQMCWSNISFKFSKGHSESSTKQTGWSNVSFNCDKVRNESSSKKTC